MRVLVIGGRGYFGSKIVDETRKVPGAEVVVASRSGDVVVDLRNPKTFSAMDGFDYVVNCSDSFSAPPDEAIAYCLAHGLTFLETTADPATLERLVDRFRQAPAGTTGRAILGAGLFPGVSNLVARAAREAHSGTTSELDVGILLDPLAGGGPGLCALMAHSTVRPSVYYVDGRRTEGPPIGRPRPIEFAGVGSRGARRTGLPEPILLHASMPVPNLSVYVALRTRIIEPAFVLTSLIAPRSGWLQRVYIAVMYWSLFLVRAVLLRKRHIGVAISGVARGDGKETSVRVSVRNAQVATGLAVAAGVALLAKKPATEPGVYVPDEVWTLEDMVQSMCEIGANAAAIEIAR